MLRRLAVAATCAAIAAEKIPVVLVADVGIDDAAALLWLLRSPSIVSCRGSLRRRLVSFPFDSKNDAFLSIVAALSSSYRRVVHLTTIRRRVGHR